MKHRLAPIVLLTLLFPSLAYGLEMEDLVVRDGLYYKKFTEIPFTGRVTGTDSYGEKELTRTGRERVFGSSITRTDSYGQKEPTKTIIGTVLGSITTTTDSYIKKEPSRTGRKKVLGSIITKTEL